MTRQAARLAAVAALAAAVAAAILPEPPRAEEALPERRSGFDTMAPETRAMQADDTSNPGMLWVADGARLWDEPAGESNLACASCHGTAEASMPGVAARYPALDRSSRRPVDLTGRINLCRTGEQQATPLPREGDDLLALTAYVAHQSRGLPIAPPQDPALEPFRAAGEALYRRRLGQLALSCAECHDRLAGARLGGNVVPEAHPTGYPVYRLEWQALGSLQRRLRNCMTGVRAEPFAPGAPELVELELFLMDRAAGMPLETPGVRP